MAEVPKRSVVRCALPALLLALLGSMVLAAPAFAQPEGARVKSYVNTRSTDQAGAHPDVHFEFELGTRIDPFIPDSCFCNTAKDVGIEFPAGFIGNPHAVPQCTVAQFTLGQCPIDSQVGTTLAGVLGIDRCCLQQQKQPLYNLVPQPGQAGLLAFKVEVFQIPVYTVIGARTGSDYGLNGEVKGIPQFLPLKYFQQDIWGVPAASTHDSTRARIDPVNGLPYYGYASNSPEKPFLSNPTSCVGPLTTTLTSTAYDRGVHSATAPWSETTGCDQLNFNPSQSANPTTEAADSPSGLDVILKVPQSDSPNTPSDSEIKGTVVRFPEGLSINPSAADGKSSCSDQQAHLGAYGSEEEAQCPEFAKIGTSLIDSWALPGPIPGGIYLGDPKPGDRYRVIVTADGYGTHVKFAGSTKLDPKTGQLTAIFENLPQAPVTEFSLHFFGSERGLFATPEKCGTYPVESEFEPWSGGPNQTSIQFFKVTSGPGRSPCPGTDLPFKPSFRASGTSNGAGAHSPFSTYVTRQDGEQTLNTIGVKTPPGFTATLKGVAKCSDQTLREIESSSWTGKSARQLQVPDGLPSRRHLGRSRSWLQALLRPGQGLPRRPL